MAHQHLIHPAQSDGHTCCACGIKIELGKMKEKIMQTVRAEPEAAHDREISKSVEVMRADLETFKVEIIRDLKKGKGVDASAKPHVEHADISEGDDNSNEELLDDLDLGHTDRDESFDSKEEIDSREETLEEFLPSVSNAENEAGVSCLTEKVTNPVDIEATIPSPTRKSPRVPLSGFRGLIRKQRWSLAGQMATLLARLLCPTLLS